MRQPGLRAARGGLRGSRDGARRSRVQLLQLGVGLERAGGPVQRHRRARGPSRLSRAGDVSHGGRRRAESFLSSVGSPIDVWRGAAWQQLLGWGESAPSRRSAGAAG